MFETVGLELIAFIALIVLVLTGALLWGVASYRKKRRWQELERSGEFTATYDESQTPERNSFVPDHNSFE